MAKSKGISVRNVAGYSLKAGKEVAKLSRGQTPKTPIEQPPGTVTPAIVTSTVEPEIANLVTNQPEATLQKLTDAQIAAGAVGYDTDKQLPIYSIVPDVAARAGGGDPGVYKYMPRSTQQRLFDLGQSMKGQPMDSIRSQMEEYQGILNTWNERIGGEVVPIVSPGAVTKVGLVIPTTKQVIEFGRSVKEYKGPVADVPVGYLSQPDYEKQLRAAGVKGDVSGYYADYLQSNHPAVVTDSLKSLKDAGVIRPDNTVDIVKGVGQGLQTDLINAGITQTSIDRSISYERLVKARVTSDRGVDVVAALDKGMAADLRNVGVTDSEIAAARKPTAVVSQPDKWERDVLPTLPKEFQDAYRAGDTAKMEKLAADYQKQYDDWAKQFTASELAETQSGQYQVLDFDTNTFVPVTKAIYEGQEELYSEMPEAGTSPGKLMLPRAIEARQKAVEAQKAAVQRLNAAGFVEGKPTVTFKSAGSPPIREFTIPNIAEFIRKNTDGAQVMMDYGFGEDVLSEASQWNAITGSLVARLDKGVMPIGTGLSASLGLTSAEISALGRALDQAGVKPVNGSYVVAWRGLDDDKKRAAAVLFDKDYSKGSSFASFARDIESISSKNLALMLMVAPIQPITTPIGKQLTLDEAKKQLGKEYAVEIQALRGYVQQDGTFDVDRLDKEFKATPEMATKALSETGYKSVDDLKSNLDYYNYATRVTPKEWVVAGLVGVLDALMLGGGALASLGGAGKLITEGLTYVAPVSLGVLQAPEVAKVLASPKVGGGEKAVAAIGEAAMFISPLVGPAIRSMQFANLVGRGDYVPLRSMSMESATARVPFNKVQLARMQRAGVTEADIIRAGTEINKQLASGAKKAVVDLGPLKVRVKNVPYQTDVGLSLFNSTPDITLVDRGGSVPIIRDFYTAGKVAIEPLERSYLTGQRATAPGIVEIRISDPELIAKIAPQRRLISGGKTLEPEAPIPSLDELQGMGYRLDPIPGKAGRGVSFDANLGQLEIRRFTLSKVADVPAGLVRIRLGGSGDGGVVAIGDLHGTSNFRGVFNDINSSFDTPVIKGDPNKPATWHWTASASKGRTVVVLGDSIDRGPAYNLWRDTFNRLHDEAIAAGDKVERLLGNHELAYIADDAIKGIKYTDRERAIIKQALLDDIATGRVTAAVSADGKLFTHAGVSKGLFGEYAGRNPDYIASDLNKTVLQAVKRGDYDGKVFAKGRVEKGNSLSENERAQGGIFWLRPQEAKLAELDLGFTQVVGHNPGFGVRRIWGDNFVETDIGRRAGRTGVYADTPYVTTQPAKILTVSLGGEAPRLSGRVMAGLRLKAMRDTVADVFLGWDGRVQAVEKIRSSQKAVKALIESLDKQIAERRAAGDSIGVQYLGRQKRELTSATGRDYLYGGIAFWRDIVMGRQNSVKILNNIKELPAARLNSAASLVGQVRDRITRMSDQDTNTLFGRTKQSILDSLDTRTLDRANLDNYRRQLTDRLSALRDIVDEGIDRSMTAYLDEGDIARRYADYYQSELYRLNSTEEPYESPYGERELARYESYRPALEVRGIEERSPRSMREPAPSRAVIAPRVPTAPRALGRVPGVRQPPPQPRTPQITERPVGVVRVTPNLARVPTVIPVVPRVPRAPPPPPPPPPLLIGGVGAGKKSRQLPQGSVTWKQGWTWKWIPPEDFSNGVKPRSLARGIIPEGARFTDKLTTKETIQVIGDSGASVPENIKADLGIQDLSISNQAQDISFSAGGTTTDVGVRDTSPTKGMSVNQGINRPSFSKEIPHRTGELAQSVRATDNTVKLDMSQSDDEFYSQFDKSKVVNRPSMSKNKPRRKARLSNWEYMTTLKGYRP